MPVADADKLVVQIVTKGVIATGGSDVQACLNVFNYVRDNNSNPLSKTNIASKFDTIIFQNYVGELHTSYTCDELLVRFLNDNLDPYLSVPVTAAGAVATARAPDYECVTIRLNSNVRGRNYRGRKHFSPIAEADTDGDVIAAARLAAWQAVRDLMAASFGDVDGNTWFPFIYSPSLSTLAGDLWDIKGAAVNGVVLNKTLGTIRSRKAATVV